MTKDITEEFRAFLADNGITVIGQLIADKKLHRIDIEGKRKGNKNGAYVIHPDPPPSGYFEDHSSGGIKLFWRSKRVTNQKLTAKQIKAQRRKIERQRAKREAEEQAKFAAGAERAQSFWAQCEPCEFHEYPINQKKLQATYGGRVGTWIRFVENEFGNRTKITIPNTFVIPIFNESGTLVNLQGIFRHQHPILGRAKDFVPGCRLGGCFYWIGKRADDEGTVLVAEGFATAASLHEETQCRVYVAFSAGNLEKVARIVRKRLPRAQIIIAADNDEKTRGNPGVTAATKAAAAIGGKILIPPVPGDWNDYITSLSD
ncbi:toprim domain-containing protein [Methylotuvimicrobium sp. KM1]|uniref:toprim domain-containing protein n=1 Tax=Methylotuvimicrobium sp. KM1 TaxID=3377707 RepID=UPI00384D1FB9